MGFDNPEAAVLSTAKFLSAEATLAQASTTQPPRHFFQRPTAARGSTASRPRPASADAAVASSSASSSASSPPPRSGGGRSCFLPIPPRVEGGGRFPVDVGHCSRLRHPPLTFLSLASFTNISRPDHVTLFDAEVEARQEERAIVEFSPSSPGYFGRLFLVPKPVGRLPSSTSNGSTAASPIAPAFAWTH